MAVAVAAAAADDDVMQTIRQEVLDPNDPFVKDAAKIGEGKPIGLGVEPIGPKPVPSPVNVQEEYQRQLAARTTSAESGNPVNRTNSGPKEVRFAPDTKEKKSKFCLLL